MSIPDLWLPILVSAVIVWIASALIWMALPWHKNDFAKTSDEEGVRAADHEGRKNTEDTESTEGTETGRKKKKVEQRRVGSRRRGLRDVAATSRGRSGGARRCATRPFFSFRALRALRELCGFFCGLENQSHRPRLVPRQYGAEVRRGELAHEHLRDV